MTSTESFPAGLRILVVDDEPLCLMILERMLRQCSYTVTTCSRAATALSLLRENRDKFDLVISDVYMPDMDGFKLLELIGLELDLPVIMMSADGETSAVMKGITHGACDYLLKPVRIEELRNIWQHVVRRNRKDTLKEDQSGDWDESTRQLEGHVGDSDVNSRKRKDKSDTPQDDQIEDANTLKKARVVWSIELHQQFVNAVNQLGIDKAVPKRILEIMNVQGLTRENVASHLQKYRLYLKRLSGVNPQPHPIASFQAAGEGKEFGGTLTIQPGGRSSVNPNNKSSALALATTPSPSSTPQSFMQGAMSLPGMNRSTFANIDSGTLATLTQLQALQQKQSVSSTLGNIFGNAGNNPSSQGMIPGTNLGMNPRLLGLSHIDLNLLMQDAARQRMGNMNGNEALGTLQALQGMSSLNGNNNGNNGNSINNNNSPLVPLQSNNGSSAEHNLNSLGKGPPLSLMTSLGLQGNRGNVSLNMPTLQLGNPSASPSANGLNENGLGSFTDITGNEDYLNGNNGNNQDLSSAFISQLMQNSSRNVRPKYESSFQS